MTFLNFPFHASLHPNTPLVIESSYIQVNFADNIRQLKILGSCPVTVIYRVTAIYRSSLQKRQLKILGNCLVTVIYRVTAIYRAVVYRFDCIKNLLEALAECVL